MKKFILLAGLFMTFSLPFQSCKNEFGVDKQVKSVDDLIGRYNLKVSTETNKKKFAHFESLADADEFLKRLSSIKERSYSGKIDLNQAGARSSADYGSVSFQKPGEPTNGYQTNVTEPEEVRPGLTVFTSNAWDHPFNTTVSLSWQDNYTNPYANGYLTGFTFGIYSFSQQSQSSYYTNGRFYYTISGVLNYNIFVEGVGTVYQAPFTISGSYNTATGEYVVTTQQGN